MTIAPDECGVRLVPHPLNSFRMSSEGVTIALGGRRSGWLAPSPDQLAKHVCVAEEAKGWTPHVSTQS